MQSYKITNLEALPPVPCSCGQARRAFADPGNTVATMHLVEAKQESAAHYHKHHTEIYYILDGEGYLELDGKQEPVWPGLAVFIPPGTRHRPIGTFRFLNVPVPPFDPNDEYQD